ncbi:MAG: chromosome segregation protein SMC [Chloroflexia bacterium]
MHVRQLRLLGFKTFAARTTFEFQKGITAIVGPNGSGKSNLADALRWVLGEQSYSLLRSRRTEDVIFSGSSSRPPAGMAEVTLVLDNEDGALPLDFPEVEITRRAYRSGANEYFLNRRRVRLQDVEEVLGGLTASYVVIHQGLVDEALSLRPRERRLLLEEAAEVRRYHERRQKALERLRETAANMTRLSDLRSELLPRLRTLERQSQQARQRAELESSLQEALRAWYRLLWEEISSALEQAEREEEEARNRLVLLRASAGEAARRVAALRQAAQEARQKEEERRRRVDEVRRRAGALREQLARSLGERQALERHREELQAEVARHRQELAAQEAHRDLLAQAGRSLKARLAEAQAGLLKQQERYRQVESDLRSAQQKMQKLQEEARLLAAHLQEGERRLGQLQAGEEMRLREEKELGRLLEELAEQKRRIEEEKSRAAEEQARREAAWTGLRSRQEALQAEVAERQADLERREEALEAARLHLAELRARSEALGKGGDAASFLEEWARKQGRPSLSPLLDRLTVPRGLRKALAAALGPYAQPWLSTTWEEARQALRSLEEAEAGRAVFLPREELRPPPSALAEPPALGSEGLLLDHLTCPREDRPALACLLGRVLLARDLEAARRIARGLPAGWLVVTRRGEAVSAEGVLSGGAPEEGAWDRREERRRLARALAEAEARVSEQERGRAEARERLAAARNALDALTAEVEEARHRCEEGARDLLDLARSLERLEEEAGRHRRRLEERLQERGRLEEERKRLQALSQEKETRLLALREALEQARQREKQARETYRRAHDRLEEARLIWAVARKEEENQRALEETVGRTVERLQKQVEEEERRLEEMERQLEAQAAQISSWQAEWTHLEQEMAALAEAEPPSSPSFPELEVQEAEEARLRQEILDGETAAARAALAVQRWREARRELLQRALGEIGPEASAYGPAGEALLNALLTDPPEWTRLPLDPNLTREELERRVAHLREEVRRIGPVNPLAEEEYRQTRERYDFLGQQLQDLHDAARSLEQVIVELDRAMEQRFHETFEAVQREFQAYFTRLFGGGSAALRLVRLEEEDGGLSGLGVEILARPPGKRVHSLALLSGGERALTSAALLFAILKVNPRPFCLLDEVDAMLDEANVGRFRECLQELASRTQFIVITHNRGTIEAADLLYGVSMADDGTSRVLSLRLEDLSPGNGG